MSDEFVPFNKPCFTGHEQAYIARAIEFGWIAGDGRHEALQQVLGGATRRPEGATDHELHARARDDGIAPQRDGR